MTTQQQSKDVLFGITPFQILIAVGVGILIAAKPIVAVVSLAGAVGLLACLFLLVGAHGLWRKLWVGVIAFAAFGPFLDIVTRLPLNWLIGFVVLLLFFVLSFRLLLLVPKLMAGYNFTSSQMIHKPPVIPALGVFFCLYIAYFLLQVFRPGSDPWMGLIAFRAPLIGFASYIVSLYVFRTIGGKNRVDLLNNRVLQVFVIIGVIVALYGIFQFFVGFERLSSWGLVEKQGLYLHNQRNLDDRGFTIFRIFSTMRRNEALGTFLYLHIIICAVLARSSVRYKKLIWFGLGMSVVTMILTLSLTNILTLFLWVSLIVITSRSRKMLRIGVTAAVFVFISLFVVNFFLNGLIEVRISEHLLDAEQDVGRIRMFKNWITEITSRSPIEGMVGSGICWGLEEDTLARIGKLLDQLGVSSVQYVSCKWSSPLQDNWYATHSLEIGWLGILPIWFVFFSIPLYVLPLLRKQWPEPQRGAWHMLALGILALWPSGFVGALIVYMPITVYFWSMAALLDLGIIMRPNLAIVSEMGQV